MFQTLPLNPPVDLPGVYLLQSQTTGKSYIGQSNSLLKRFRRGRYVITAPKLRAAVAELGTEDFIFIPIYFIAGHKNRLDAETRLISELDCISNGYNTNLKSADHTRGSAWITDGLTESKVLASVPIPVGWRRGRGPNSSAFGSIGGSLSRGKVWITNGAEQRRVLTTEPLPEGWSRGRGPKGIEIARAGAAAAHAAATEEGKERRRASVAASWTRRRQDYGPNGRRP